MYEFVKEEPSEGKFTDIVLEDGTAAAPALKFENDQDTGLFRPADNTLSVSTNGIERVRINNDDTTFYQRVKEQSFFNNSYLCTEREGLPLVKNTQFITEMLTYWVNPYTVAGASAKQWNTMAYSEPLDRIVALGLSGVNTDYVYSNDGGINWIVGTFVNATYSRIRYIPDTTNGAKFIALHASGNNCRFSSDGITWTQITTITAGNQRDVIYLPSYNRYVMCNSTGSPSILVNSTPSNLVLGWGTIGIVNQPDTLLISMAYSSELNILVAVGSGGTSRAWSSSDGGLTWESRSAGNNTLRDVVWAKEIGLFIAVGDFGSCQYSSDGITWSNAGTNLNSKTWTNIIWIPDLHIFVAGNSSALGNELAYSFDGKIWTPIDVAGDDFTLVNPSLNYISKHGSITFCSTTSIAGTNKSRFLMTSLGKRIPTSYNTFSHPFNQISEFGNWYIKEGANYVQFTATTTTYSPSARQYRYFSLELNNIAHATNATFTLPEMSDGDSYLVQCYCGVNTSAGRQIILSNQTGFNIWNAKTMTAINAGATTVIFQAVGGIIANTSYLFVKAQGGSVNMIELGDKQGQAQPGPIILSAGSQASPSLTFSGDTDTGLFWANNGEMRVSCNNTLNQIISQTVNTYSVPLALPNGTAGSPALRFVDTDTGFFSNGNDAINITSGGTERMYIFQDTVGFQGNTMQIRLQTNGTSARPSLSWSDATNNWDSGIYRSAEDTISVSTAGTERFRVANNETSFLNRVRNIDGTMALPSYAFTSATGSGMYLAGPITLAFSVNGLQKIAIVDGTGVDNVSVFNTRIDLPQSNNTNPAITFSGSQTHGIYCDNTNDIMSFKVGNVAVMNFNPTTSTIVSQLSTRSIINNTNLVSTASNQTITRLNTIVYGTFIYDLTGAIDVNLSAMQAGDVGLNIKIGKSSGNHALTIKPATGDYINNVLNGTYVLANADYRYVELVLAKVVGAVSYWLAPH